MPSQLTAAATTTTLTATSRVTVSQISHRYHIISLLISPAGPGHRSTHRPLSAPDGGRVHTVEGRAQAAAGSWPAVNTLVLLHITPDSGHCGVSLFDINRSI